MTRRDGSVTLTRRKRRNYRRDVALSRIRQKRVVILHEDLPRLPENDMHVYLAVLARAVQDWCGDEAHELQGVSPKSAEHRGKRSMDGTLERLIRLPDDPRAPFGAC